MWQLSDYMLAEIVYEGPETRARRATHLSSGEQLVVKLPVLDTPGLRTIGRLVHEYQLLGKLSSVSGVVRARALAHQAGSAALFLKDHGLRSLDRVLAEHGRLPLDAALQITRAICSALEGAHAAGIVHKDVKPQTVIAVENRRVSVPSMVISVGTW